MKKYLILFLIVCSTYSYSQCFAGPVEYQQISFQSTSTMRSIGSAYSSTPTINEYGTAIYNGSYSPNRVGPMKTESYNPGTPGGNPDNPQPIGDTPLPLMLLIIGFYIIRKKWKRMKSSTFYKLFTFSVYNI